MLKMAQNPPRNHSQVFLDNLSNLLLKMAQNSPRNRSQVSPFSHVRQACLTLVSSLFGFVKQKETLLLGSHPFKKRYFVREKNSQTGRAGLIFFFKQRVEKWGKQTQNK